MGLILDCNLMCFISHSINGWDFWLLDAVKLQAARSTPPRFVPQPSRSV